LLAVCLTSSIAIAAKDSATATFESLAASGIKGEAVLRVTPDGTQIHGTIRNLQPGVDYIVGLFPENKTCASGSTSQTLVRITANPSGLATFNQKVAQPLNMIGSLSVQLVSDNSVQACAAVSP